MINQTSETNKLYLILLFSLIAWLATIVGRNAKLPNNQTNQANQSQTSNQGTNQAVSRPGTPTPTGPIGDFVRPIDGRITSEFGPRIHPTLGTTRHHQGMDIAAPEGTPVKSPWHGVIDSTVNDGVCGTGLRIRHSNGLLSVYCHLSENLVSEGAQVTAGQIVAKSGNTGRSTGPHLHWGVKQDGAYVNPANYWR